MAAKKVKYYASWCIGCNMELSLDEFFKSENPMHATKCVPYCKTCAKKIFEKYKKITGNTEASIYYTCAELGIPFISRAYDLYERKLLDKKGTASFSHMGIYMSCLELIKTKTDNFDSFIRSDEIGDLDKAKKKEIDLMQELKDLKLVWGDSPTWEVKDYQYLEYRFNIYTEDLELIPSQEKLFRDLCLLELSQRKLFESDGDTKNIQGQILTIMGKLKIDQFTGKKDKSLIEQMLEGQIEYMEREEPADHYKDLEKYTDFMGFGAYFEDHVTRPMRNLLLNEREYKIKFKDKIRKKV